jgi:glycosyltransferase involved in cell wall biosynthesis
VKIEPKKTILFLLHLPPPVHGSSVVGLAIKESRQINDTFNCEYINLLASENIAETGKVNLRKIFGFVTIWFRVLFAILKKRPQLCYFALTSTGAAFFRDFLLVALLKMFRVKLIFHLHNKGVSKYQDKVIHLFCYTFVFRNAEVILLSKLLYKDVSWFVPESAVHVCPNGIPDLAEQIIVERQTEKVQILFLSNLLVSKGVYVLLEACARLKKKLVSFECVFVGGEGDISKTNFEEQVRFCGLDDEVRYLGRKFGQEKTTIFAESDIFAFPTYSECFPLVLLEAMSFSLPVVSTPEGGIPDEIDDGVTGYIVPRQNADALADRLEELILNPKLRRQMGNAGREKFKKEFTSNRFETRLKEILQQSITV